MLRDLYCVIFAAWFLVRASDRSLRMKKSSTQIPRPDRTKLYESEVYLELKRTLADNLKRIRAERQLTQEQLAHECGLAVRQYQAIEGAEANATLLTVARLMEGIGISGGELIDPPAKKKR